jgi:hypothetical protein
MPVADVVVTPGLSRKILMQGFIEFVTCKYVPGK